MSELRTVYTAARKLTRVCGRHALSGDVTKVFLPDRRDCQSKNRSRSSHNTGPEDDGLFMCKVLLSDDSPSRVSARKSIQNLETYKVSVSPPKR